MWITAGKQNHSHSTNEYRRYRRDHPDASECELESYVAKTGTWGRGRAGGRRKGSVGNGNARNSMRARSYGGGRQNHGDRDVDVRDRSQRSVRESRDARSGRTGREDERKRW